MARYPSLFSRPGPPHRATGPPGCGGAGGTIAREQVDWGYESEPYAGEEVKPVRRKRLLGGTSWLTRFTPRGSPADYNGWVDLGLTGWGWEGVLPYFVKL